MASRICMRYLVASSVLWDSLDVSWQMLLFTVQDFPIWGHVFSLLMSLIGSEISSSAISLSESIGQFALSWHYYQEWGQTLDWSWHPCCTLQSWVVKNCPCLQNNQEAVLWFAPFQLSGSFHWQMPRFCHLPSQVETGFVFSFWWEEMVSIGPWVL